MVEFEYICRALSFCDKTIDERSIIRGNFICECPYLETLEVIAINVLGTAYGGAERDFRTVVDDICLVVGACGKDQGGRKCERNKLLVHSVLSIIYLVL